MNCTCFEFPLVFDGNSVDVQSIEQMPRICKEHVTKWQTRYLLHRKCGICGQVWRITKSRSANPRLYFKIPANVKAEEYDDTELRIEFVLKQHGRHRERKCNWAKCDKLSLQDLAFCEFHTFYGMGVQK